MDERKPDYKEIRELYEYCKRIGVKATLEPMFDGYALRFVRGDFVQHFGSRGSIQGCVEPCIRCDLDYNGVTLEAAKHLVKKHRNKLNGNR